ncbi:MAG: hypothetical protein WCQ99_02360 [Pseudomonadota bacterium]
MLDKIKEYQGFKKDIQLVRDIKEKLKLENFVQSKLFGWRKRNTLQTTLIDYCLVCNIPINEMFGHPLLGSASDWVHDDNDSEEIKGLLCAARRVLTSGIPQAVDALTSNIKYFDHAVSVEKLLPEDRKKNSS